MTKIESTWMTWKLRWFLSSCDPKLTIGSAIEIFIKVHKHLPDVAQVTSTYWLAAKKPERIGIVPCQVALLPSGVRVLLISYEEDIRMRF